MSISDVRKQYRALNEEFLGGTISKMSKAVIEHRMVALRGAIALKSAVPEPDAKIVIGPPSARAVKTKDVVVDGTDMTVPLAPTEGAAHAATYKKKAKASPEVAESPAEKPKKVRITPPKVVLADDAAAVVPKIKKVVVKKVAPVVEATAPAPAPAPTPVKLPAGVRLA